MKLPLTPALPRLDPPPAQRPLLPSAPGTRLAGNVVRDGDAGLAVRAGRLTLPLPRGAGLAPGDQLTLQVTREQGRLALEIVEVRRPAPEAGTSVLRRHQPLQQPLGEALRGLPAALRPAGGSGAGPQPQAADAPAAARAPGPALSPAARGAAEALLAALPRPEQLADAEGLRQALRDSGVLLEPLLARVAPERAAELAGRDVKALLARFAERLRGQTADSDGGPPADEGLRRQLLELVRGSEAALSRLALLQLQPAQGGEAARLDLAFELLVNAQQELDTLDLRLRGPLEDDGGADDPGGEDDDWSVDMSLTFADGDRLEARLWLAGKGLGVRWWTESEALRTRIETLLPQLRQRLEAAGLEVATLEAWPGRPRQRADAVTQPVRGMLDERA